MAEVYCEIYLIRLGYLKTASLLFHVDSNEFIADFRSMLSIVYQAELICLNLVSQGFIFVNLNAFAFNFLLPADLIQALSEQYHISKHNLIKGIIYLLRDLKQIKCENFIHIHCLSIIVIQIFIVSLPLFLVT